MPRFVPLSLLSGIIGMPGVSGRKVCQWESVTPVDGLPCRPCFWDSLETAKDHRFEFEATFNSLDAARQVLEELWLDELGTGRRYVNSVILAVERNDWDEYIPIEVIPIGEPV